MKITKNQLKKIIMEEHARLKIRRLLREYGDLNDPYNPDADPNLVTREMTGRGFDQEFHFVELVDKLLRSSRPHDEVFDAYLFQLDDAGIQYTQDDLEALAERIYEEEDIDLFVGTKGAE